MYPVNLKQTSGLVDSVPTSISVHSFSDKILITITQDGRLAQWFQVSMDSTSASYRDTYLPSSSSNNTSDDPDTADEAHDTSLLPLPHLTARTLLGNSTPEREATGQLFAVQIASAIAMKDPNETRAVLLGLGLRTQLAQNPSREAFFDLMGLVVGCL